MDVKQNELSQDCTTTDFINDVVLSGSATKDSASGV
jgi:hypothetical protein